MANGADSCCLLLLSGPFVNYCPSFQMLSIIMHADSSAKFVCTLQQAACQSPEAQSCEQSRKLKNSLYIDFSNLF
jgi:hypothetical protein